MPRKTMNDRRRLPLLTGEPYRLRYRAEYGYRFNRGFDWQMMRPRFLSVTVKIPPMPYPLLPLAEVYGSSRDV